MDTLSLSNHFLLATPSMDHPLFSHSLIYVCEHKPQGAMGIIVNKPSAVGLAQLFEQIGLTMHESGLTTTPILFGGPIQFDRGFVLHTHSHEWQSSLTVNNDLMLTTSKDILVATAEGHGPERLIVTLGYAGWSKGQLEKELAGNAWISIPASLNILFDLPASERYEAAMASLGFNPALLSSEIGYA